MIARPRCWPRWMRRAFLLTLPFSIGAWLTVFLSVNLLMAFRSLSGAIADFWNAPRRHRYSYGLYGYSVPSKQGARSETGGEGGNLTEGDAGLAAAE